LVLMVACVVAGLVLAPKGLDRFAANEVVVIGTALVILAAVNYVLLRRAFTPLERLGRFAGGVDLATPGQRVSVDGASSEVHDLADAFNDMLQRLESEQRENTRRVLAAQEDERRRISQELHDEVGQTLTAVLLLLGSAAARAPQDLKVELAETLEAARGSLEDVRRIAVELRPDELDELGLASALTSLCQRLSERTGLQIDREISRDLGRLTPEQELVVYRVAQEALTNVVRHAQSAHAFVSLCPSVDDGALVLLVRDQGRGFVSTSVGTGLRGMRERADLIGAKLSIGQEVGGGVRVELELPTKPS
jgi:two-component system sensor histidine kinase UhpB